MVTQLDRRQVLRVFGGLAVAGLTGAASACAVEPQGTAMERPSGLTIPIGLIAPALGPYSKIGADITNGFRLYLSDHANLLGRHQVQLHTAEEGATAQSALAAAEQLLGEGVIALAGLANPAALPAVAAAVNEAKVPLVAAGGPLCR